MGEVILDTVGMIYRQVLMDFFLRKVRPELEWLSSLKIQNFRKIPLALKASTPIFSKTNNAKHEEKIKIRTVLINYNFNSKLNLFLMLDIGSSIEILF